MLRARKSPQREPRSKDPATEFNFDAQGEARARAQLEIAETMAYARQALLDCQHQHGWHHADLIRRLEEGKVRMHHPQLLLRKPDVVEPRHGRLIEDMLDAKPFPLFELPDSR